METKLTKCYAIWIRDKKEGVTLFFGGEMATKHTGESF